MHSDDSTPVAAPVPMDQVAIQLGIPVQRLRKMRGSLLTEGEHWHRDPADDRCVLFTAGGVEKLRSAVLGSASATETSVSEPTPPELPPVPENAPREALGTTPVSKEEVMEVVSWPRQFPDGSSRHFPNPNVIRARRPNGEVVYVRVSSSAHFVPKTADGTPMTLTARLDGEPAIWCLVGRCPRWVGRW